VIPTLGLASCNAGVAFCKPAVRARGRERRLFGDVFNVFDMRKYRRIVISDKTHHPVDEALELLLRDGDRFWLRCEQAGVSTQTLPDESSWDADIRAGEFAARDAIDLTERDASIWVRDVHLMHVARALRRAGFRGRIGVYLDAPLDALETSPLAAELIAALLAFDRVGFRHATASTSFFVAARRFGVAIATDGAIASRYRITETEVAARAIDVARRCLKGPGKHHTDVRSLPYARAVRADRRLRH
jgi:hypothetical protein